MAYAPFDLSGKVALVTGGNRGIGLGMARALAKSGADIVIWGTSESYNEAALEELGKLGVRAKAQKVDVSDEAAVGEGMSEAVAAMGRVDTVIANAGIGAGARSFSEMTVETWRRVLSVNLDGVFFTCREACKHMVERANTGDRGWFDHGDRVSRGHRRRRSQRGLCRHQGRGDLHDEIDRRRTRAIRGSRQFDPAGLDRDRHDPRRPNQHGFRRKSHSPDPSTSLGRTRRLRRYRGLPRLRCVAIPLR